MTTTRVRRTLFVGVLWGCLVSLFLWVGPSLAQSEEQTRLYARFDQALRMGDFDQARQMGAQFAETYPDSADILRVEYWLGCIEPDYEEALDRLEAVIEKAGDSSWAVLAARRIGALARLQGRVKDAIVPLREAERRGGGAHSADGQPELRRLRLEMALAFLSVGRESAASKVLDRLENPEELPELEQELYAFSRAMVLWEKGREKEFWQQVLEFENRFPKSSHLPSLQWIASGYSPEGGRRRRKVDQELLREIAEYFPDSPEAYLARRALRSM